MATDRMTHGIVFPVLDGKTELVAEYVADSELDRDGRLRLAADLVAGVLHEIEESQDVGVCVAEGHLVVALYAIVRAQGFNL